MPKVFICGPIPRIGTDLLSRAGFEYEISPKEENLSGQKLKEIFSLYDAVISMVNIDIDESLISSAGKNLKVIANYAVGYDNIDVEAAKKKGITVCNTPGVATESVAEHVFALILGLKKFLLPADSFVRAGKYKSWDPELFVSNQLWGQTIGIIGLGRIGTFVGQIAYGGFRMKILYFDPRRAEDFEMLCEATYADVQAIVREADIVTLHVPLVAQTKHLIGRQELSMMKKTAILINTSRGPVVDEKALIDALKDGEIAAAGLDVFEHEPDIPKELRDLENVILTPHTASATSETREQMAKIAAQNIIDVFEGKEPFGLVRI